MVCSNCASCRNSNLIFLYPIFGLPDRCGQALGVLTANLSQFSKIDAAVNLTRDQVLYIVCGVEKTELSNI